VEHFLAGDPTAWNPFKLTVAERLFLLFHLIEVDGVTAELIEDLGDVPIGTTLEAADAARMTCRALFRVLDAARDEIEPRLVPSYRTARDLATTIAEELGLRELLAGAESDIRRRAPKPTSPRARPVTVLGRSRPGGKKRSGKSADHQAIPRFEQLVDLGFATKPAEEEQSGEDTLSGRRRWRYMPTEACKQWHVVRRELPESPSPFAWDGFARAATAAFTSMDAVQQPRPGIDIVAKYLWRAYERVRRPVGHTPLESVALFGMILAAADSVVIEMVHFHQLALSIKQRSAMPEHAFFASGNDLDKMFIQLRPGFLEKAEAIKGALSAVEES
jgi:hypothetical protein